MIKKRELALNTGLVLSSVIFAVLAVEAGLRLFAEAPLYARYMADVQQENIDSEGLPDPGFYEYTPTGVRLRINASGYVHNHSLVGGSVPLRTNQYGFRGPAIVSDERKLAIFLGDSITIADYLVEEETFVHLVGELSRSGNHPLQTVNAGVGSTSIEEQYNLLHETGRLAEPDIVVLNLYLNDWHASPAMFLIPIPRALRWSRAAQMYYQKKSVEAHEAGMDETGGWIPEAVQAGWKQAAILEFPPAAEEGDWARDRAAYNFLMQQWFWDWGSAYSAGARERIFYFARKIIDVSREIDAQLVVVIHPTSFQVEAEFDTNEPQIAFVEYFENAGVPVFDLLPAMREHYRNNPEVPLFYDHCHHSPAGAAFVANHIYPFIMQSLDAGQ
jgi:hypothetical protein